MADPRKPADPRNRSTSPGAKPAPKPAPKPADRAGAKPAARPATRPAEPPRPLPPPPKKRTPQPEMKLVKRQPAKAPARAAEGKAGDSGSTPRRPVVADPERLGRILYDRPGWLDEIASILLIVFGMVSMLSLLNTSSTAALTNLWSTTIRQIFGQVGAVMISIMIAIAGALILLPRIGIVIRVSWLRIVIIEVAFFAFLAVLHLLARDAEPRALARGGQGGGYIGWALSEIPLKLLGQGLTLMLFIGIAVVAIGTVLGIRRAHIRAWLLTTSKRLEALATYMKNAPQRRRALPADAGHVRQIGAAASGLAAEPACGYASPIGRKICPDGTPAAPTRCTR